LTADVVVVSYNGREILGRCLDHLRVQTAGCRLIVVDNASSDGSGAFVRMAHPDAMLLEMAQNVGFGRAVNAGVAAGEGEAVVLVNSDVLAEPHCVEALMAPLRANDRVGMVAGLTLIPTSGLVDAFGIELDETLSAYNRLRNRRPGETAGVLAGPSAGLAAYRRAAFEAVGGFDEALFAYGEDVDLALRLRREGWQAAAAPDARAVHLGGASFGVDSPLQRYLAGFARGFLLRRYGVLGSRAAARAIVFEMLVVGWGLLRFRSTVPLRARVAGWREAGSQRMVADPSAIDLSVGWREALRRLRQDR
jgi:N-acetylglucosaminyl-diphospho-decaprenol L-rhamnosyltransferase